MTNNPIRKKIQANCPTTVQKSSNMCWILRHKGNHLRTADYQNGSQLTLFSVRLVPT